MLHGTAAVDTTRRANTTEAEWFVLWGYFGVLNVCHYAAQRRAAPTVKRELLRPSCPGLQTDSKHQRGCNAAACAISLRRARHCRERRPRGRAAQRSRRRHACRCEIGAAVVEAANRECEARAQRPVRAVEARCRHHRRCNRTTIIGYPYRKSNARLRPSSGTKPTQIGGCSAEGQCHRTSSLRPPCT